MSFAINLIAAKHAKNLERFPPEDNEVYHQNGELRMAAIFTLTSDEKYYPRNWSAEYFRKSMEELDDIENHVNTCALLCAEIERLAKEKGLIPVTTANDTWKIIDVPGKGSVLFLKDQDANGFNIVVKSEIPIIAPGMVRGFGHNKAVRDAEFSDINIVYARIMIEGVEAYMKPEKPTEY
jgi:hypothetical protein